MCLSPILIWNKERGKAQPINDLGDLDEIFGDPAPRGSVPPPPVQVEDHGLPFRIVPCGRCIECAKARRSSWYVRLRRQIECGNYAQVYWVTWTFKDSTLPSTPEQMSKVIRLYKDRMRKKYGFTPDHFMISERGCDDRYSKRLHFHGFLMFKKRVTYESIRADWRCNGFVWVENLDGMKGITYAMKYIFKSAMLRWSGDQMCGKIYASLGMGMAELNRYSYRNRVHFANDPASRPTISFDGKFKYQFPRYLSDKIYKAIGYKPALNMDTLLSQLLGERPPDCRSIDSWLAHRQQTINKSILRKDSYSRYRLNVSRAFSKLFMSKPFDVCLTLVS